MASMQTFSVTSFPQKFPPMKSTLLPLMMERWS